jgi:hypothetical protein
MILVETRRLAVALTVAVVAFIPPAILAAFGENAFWPAHWAEWAAPLVFVGELALYVVLLSSQRQVNSYWPPLVVASILVGMQTGPQTTPLGVLFTDFWMGSPTAVGLQLIALVFALPVALHLWAPGFLSRQSLEQLTAWAMTLREEMLARRAEMEVVAAVTPPAAPGLSDPWPETSGPQALQPFLYKFEDLARYYQKVIGLEGFVLLDEEGLMIWHSLPWRADVRVLAGELCRWRMAAEPLGGLGQCGESTAVLHTGDHWVVSAPLPLGATLHLFYTGRLPVAQVAQTTPRLTEAARALFDFRYCARSASPRRAEAVRT